MYYHCLNHDHTQQKACQGESNSVNPPLEQGWNEHGLTRDLCMFGVNAVALWSKALTIAVQALILRLSVRNILHYRIIPFDWLTGVT